jgi:hypothetical protein
MAACRRRRERKSSKTPAKTNHMRLFFAAASLSLVLSACAPHEIPATITDLDLGTNSTITAASLGLDGRIWFAPYASTQYRQIAAIDANGQVTKLSLLSVPFTLYIGDVAVQRNGTVWVTLRCFAAFRCPVEAGYGKVTNALRPEPQYARSNPIAYEMGLSPRQTARTSLDAPQDPTGISVDARGTAWMSETLNDAILRVTKTGDRRLIHLADRHFDPFNIKAARGGVYFTGAEAGKIGWIDDRMRVHWVPMPDPTSHVTGMDVDSQGRVWAAELEANKIVSVDRDGIVREYPIPSANSLPAMLAVDATGTAWFLEPNPEKLGKIDASGRISDAYLPDGVGEPEYLFAGPDRQLFVIGYTKRWFGMSRTWSVARIDESAPLN